MRFTATILLCAALPVSSALALQCLTPKKLSQYCWQGKQSNCPAELQSKNLPWGVSIRHDASRIHFQAAQWINGTVNCTYGVNISGVKLTIHQPNGKGKTSITAPANTYTEIGYTVMQNIKSPTKGQWGKAQSQCTTSAKRCSISEANGTLFTCKSKTKYHQQTVVFGQALKADGQIDCLYYKNKPRISKTLPFNPTALVFNTIDMPKSTVKLNRNWHKIPLKICHPKNNQANLCVF